VEGKFLFALVALLAGKLDGIELPEPTFRHRDGRKTRAYCGGNRGQNSVSVRVSVDPVNQGIFDTVEVWGSSPHGPTIFFNRLASVTAFIITPNSSIYSLRL